MIGLIIGANGRIGNVVHNTLTQTQTRTISATEILSTSYCGLETLGKQFAKENVGWVLNCAGYTEMDSSNIDPRLSKDFNYNLVEKILRICESGSFSLVHLSSDVCYLPNFLKKPDDLGCLYGYYKKQSELVILNSNVPSLIVRFGWPYSLNKDWLSKYIVKGQAGCMRIQCADDLRHPTDIDDIANLFMYLLRNGKISSSNILNIGSPKKMYKGNYIYSLIRSNPNFHSVDVLCESRVWSSHDNKTLPLPEDFHVITRFNEYIFENKILDLE